MLNGMKRLILALCVLLAWVARASDVILVVTEVTAHAGPGAPMTERVDWKEATRSFVVGAGDLTIIPFEGAHGRGVAPIAKYTIKPATSDQLRLGYGDLCIGDKHLVRAEDILCQCSVDGRDIVVVRKEYNSFSNPLRWLYALSGHPVQVSEIWAIIADKRGVLKMTLLARGTQVVYGWRCAAFEKLPQ
jgi:hypothetical protein